MNFKMKNGGLEEKNVVNSRAWIQTAINRSETIPTKPFRAKKLVSLLPEFRTMSMQSPDIIYPRMKEIFLECGVAFVLVPSLKNAEAEGVVRWITKDKVLFAMNHGELDQDRFRFLLFVGIKHILQQKIKTTFIHGKGMKPEKLDEALEKEAEEFTEEMGIHPKSVFRK